MEEEYKGAKGQRVRMSKFQHMIVDIMSKFRHHVRDRMPKLGCPSSEIMSKIECQSLDIMSEIGRPISDIRVWTSELGRLKSYVLDGMY